MNGTFLSSRQPSEERDSARVFVPAFNVSIVRHIAFLKCFRFHLKINFCVNVSCVDRDLS